MDALREQSEWATNKQIWERHGLIPKSSEGLWVRSLLLMFRSAFEICPWWSWGFVLQSALCVFSTTTAELTHLCSYARLYVKLNDVTQLLSPTGQLTTQDRTINRRSDTFHGNVQARVALTQCAFRAVSEPTCAHDLQL